MRRARHGKFVPALAAQTIYRDTGLLQHLQPKRIGLLILAGLLPAE
jgi:hypothetical protein